MSVPGDGGDPPGRAFLIALAAMAAVALFVGLALAAAAMTFVQVTGLGNASGSAASRPSLYMPKYQPTKTPGTGYASPTPTPSPTTAPTPTAKPQTDQIKLFAAPQQVSPGQRINLNGVYVNGEGVALQIQEKDRGGRWTDFPVQVIVQGGAFDTWISTSHTGRIAFRVYDQQANRASNPVTVTVG